MRYLVAGLLLLVACDGVIEKEGKRDPDTRSVGGPRAAPTPQPKQDEDADPWADEDSKHRAAGPAEQAPPEPKPAEEAKKRDLGEELVAAMRSSVSCLKPRHEGSSPNVDISLSAQVMPSGSVLRGSVSGAGLDAEESACMQGRLLQVRFAAPVEGAPVGASGVLKLELQPRPKTP